MAAPQKGTAAPSYVDVCVSSCEQLVSTGSTAALYSHLQIKKRPRLYSYVYGPYRQHQVLVDSVLELKASNQCQGQDVPGRMLRVGPTCLGGVPGKAVAQLLWYLALLLPFVFVLLGEVHGGTAMLCCCCIILCVLVSVHSITIFFTLHNSKIAKRFWFISKVDVNHCCGRETSVVEVTVDNIMDQPYLSAGQKSQIITRLARSDDKRGTMMICARSFWVSRVLDPLLCLLLVLSLSLIALIISLDLLRRLHF